MRKKKKKYANVIMLLLILLVLFYIVFQDKHIKVSAEELVSSYSSNINAANKKFLNKEIELTGEVKSFFQFESEKSLLEVKTTNDAIKLHCIMMNKQIEEKVSSLTAGTSVTVLGKCLGLDLPEEVKFRQSIYIEAERIK